MNKTKMKLNKKETKSLIDNFGSFNNGHLDVDLTMKNFENFLIGTTSTTNSACTKISTRDALHLLKKGFKEIETLKRSDNSGGTRRGKKGKIIEEFARNIILAILDEKNLDLTLVEQRAEKIGKEWQPKLDLSLVDNQEKIAYMIELGDYKDSPMLDSLFFKFLGILQNNPKSKMIVLTMQKSVSKEVIQDKKDLIKTNEVYVKSFLPIDRVSKNEFKYFLDVSDNDLEKYLSDLEDFLRKTIV